MTDEERRAIEQDCARLVVAFHIHIDAYDHEQVLDLFAEDATINHCVVGLLRGKGGIAAYLEAKDNTSVYQHVTSNILIDVIDEAHARGISYWTAYSSTAAPLPAPMTGAGAVGLNEDSFIRTPAGWKFQSRRQVPRLTASQLGRDALLKGGAPGADKLREANAQVST